MDVSHATAALRSVRVVGPLVCRRHVDFCRTSSAICPSVSA
ncbi:hypothetical protein AB0G79_11045 [Streptomyces sp. NPDC020807]